MHKKRSFKWQANVSNTKKVSKTLHAVRSVNHPNTPVQTPKPHTPLRNFKQNRPLYPQRGRGWPGRGDRGRGSGYYPPPPMNTYPQTNANHHQHQMIWGNSNASSDSRGGYYQNTTQHNGWRDEYAHQEYSVPTNYRFTPLMDRDQQRGFLGNPNPQWWGPSTQTPTGNRLEGKRREREEVEQLKKIRSH